MKAIALPTDFSGQIAKKYAVVLQKEKQE